MTPDELTHLRELHEKASPAPWWYATEDLTDEESRTQLRDRNGRQLLDSVDTSQLSYADMELISETRNALPALLELTQRAERAEALLARINRAHPEIYEQALAASTAAEAQAWEEGFTQGAAYYHESGKEPADFTETAATLNPYKEQA